MATNGTPWNWRGVVTYAAGALLVGALLGLWSMARRLDRMESALAASASCGVVDLCLRAERLDSRMGDLARRLEELARPGPRFTPADAKSMEQELRAEIAEVRRLCQR